MASAQIRKRDTNDPPASSTDLARSSRNISREPNSSSMPSSYTGQKPDTSSIRSGATASGASQSSSEEEDDDEGYLYQGSSASFASAAGYIHDGGRSPPTSSLPRGLPMGISPYNNYNLSFSSNHSHQSSITSASCLSPTAKSPWSWHMMSSTNQSFDGYEEVDEMGGNSNYYKNPNRLMGSLVREEGHIYSLAASNDLLYTGSDSKNIRVWRNQKEFSVFKANSGLVKSIVISGGDRIFTGHQDGKIRVWKVSLKNPTIHKKIATLPTLKAFIKSSMKPSNYVEASRKNQRNAPWIRHSDAISSLSLSEDKSLLYSASWDRTVKVWRVSNFKCLESIAAHMDAVNAVVSGFDGLVFTGSADGTVKVWRREHQGKGTKHYFSQTLVKHECAVTALAVDPTSTIVYCGSSDGLVNYWERGHLSNPGEELRAHKLAVLCLATAGRLVFTGSADMNICVWKRDERTNHHVFLSMLTGHSGPVKCLAAGMREGQEESATGGNYRWILYSGSLDKSVKMWQVCEQATSAESAPPFGRRGSAQWR